MRDETKTTARMVKLDEMTLISVEELDSGMVLQVKINIKMSHG